MEEWKMVAGCRYLYEVSNEGHVRSIARVVQNWPSGERLIRGRVLKCTIDKAGYRRADIRTFGTTRKNMLVHRMVAMAFVENKDSKPCVNHIDGNKTNNDHSNLEWCTHQENMKHAFDTGLTPRKVNVKGERGISAKLKDSEVVEIKKRLRNGDKPKRIAADYPVGASSISEIKAGRSWKHIN